MALIKCHECDKEISSEAKACPHCGAKPRSMTAKVILVLVGSVVIWSIYFGGGADTSTPPTAEEKAQKEAENARYAVAAATSKLIRGTMRDPESLKFEIMGVNEDASVLCAKYRARNGFGGMNREFVVVANGKTSQKPSAWNRHCTKSMYDMLWAAK